ncbi:hypothetical protein KY316_03480 [Candidatus Woesearchaeota archaeon]|nr:hypothetical protein [Candidatus Woesearchaeota archaeon]
MECTICDNITAFENGLDERADKLVQMINEFCAPQRNRNNERWKIFADWCRLPVVGDAVYYFLRAPLGLEDEPKFYEEKWYKEEESAIMQKACELEKQKAAHLEHWGNELVRPMLRDDPAGYYTPPFPISRRDCYDPDYCSRTKRHVAGHGDNIQEHYIASLPRKYDFFTRGRQGIVVMDRSKRIVALNDCDWKTEGDGLITKIRRRNMVYSYNGLVTELRV